MPRPATDRLIWPGTSGTGNATSYHVKRSTTNGGPYRTVIYGGWDRSVRDPSVTNGVTYYYVVSAVNGLVESANSAAANVTPGLDNGTYAIVSQYSSLAVDDPGGAINTGVDQEPYSGGNQKWTITWAGNNEYKIVAANGAALSGPTTGAQLVVTNFTGAANQSWTFQPVDSFGYGAYFIIYNAGTGQVIDDFNNSTTAGSVIGQW